MLQIMHLKGICHDYLVSKICSSNVIEIWRHARQFSDTTLEEFASNFILENLNEICQDLEFPEMATNEKSTHSFQHCNKEMKSIQLTNDTDIEQIILSIIQPCKDLAMSSSLLLEEKRNSFAGSETTLVTAGGYNNGLVRTCENFSSKSMTWTEATAWKLPEDGYCHWVGVVGVRLYAMIGSSPISVSTLVSILSPPAATHLHTRELVTSWEHEFTTPYDCSNMRFCVMSGNVYGCGMIVNSNSSLANANFPMQVCQYSTGNGQWDVLEKLEIKSSVFFQLDSYRGRLLVIGGLDALYQIPVTTFMAYCPKSGKVEKLPPLKQPRYNFGTAVFGNNLYAIGGYGLDGRLIHSVEKYDFDAGVWSNWIYLPYPRGGMACFITRGVLYCIGGEEYKDGTTTLEVGTLVLKLSEEKWCSISSLVIPRILFNIFKL